jgi:uncharacterized delta-60 repeat protein
LDPTFGNAGTASITPPYSNFFTPAALAVQSDGKVVVVGEGLDSSNGASDSPLWMLARYNTDGTPDKTFGAGSSVGGNGYFYTDVFEPFQPNYGASATAVAIQPDGKIVVAGAFNNGEDEVGMVARYLPNGVLDTTFGTTGVVGGQQRP